MTKERAARCAAARTAFAQCAKFYRSEAPNHFRRVVFQAGLEVAPLTYVFSLSETLRVRRLLSLRKQLSQEHENMKPSLGGVGGIF